jgi:hypothetical protein
VSQGTEAGDMGPDDFLRAVVAAARRAWPTLSPEEVVVKFQGGRVLQIPVDPTHLRSTEAKGKGVSLSGIKREVLKVIEAGRRRYHLSDMMDALKAQSVRASSKQVQRVLTALQRDGVCDNEKDQHGSGYGLVAWSE